MKSKNYFKQVKELVESGLTISEAIDDLEIPKNSFYKSITKEQKNILNTLSAENKNRQFGDEEMLPTQELHEFFTSTEYE